MCSIAGSFSKEQTEKMIDKMKHRAPDGSSVYFDGKFAIGMGRLAIIDLKSDGLCLYQEDGVSVAFNGEIYNYLDLKKELSQLGHKFKTTSDTEVLYKSFKEWGVNCFKKFNGMFAIAIYDGNRIILARDIAGEKPLYYTKNPFNFASEAKALYFDCETFPKAHYGIYELKGDSFKLFCYWKLKKRDIDLKTAEDELEALLNDSIRLRTGSDVPYGLYYSQGIDSSLISTFHGFKHIFTYEDKDYKEEYLEKAKDILWHLDYPIESFSPFGLWKLAEMASKEVKVVLSGEGADELFGGYVRYMPDALMYQAQQKFPSYKEMFPYTKDVNEAGWDEFNGNMQELLRMGDRMSSAFGIENRCPFLDKRIIEFAFSLPVELKVQGFETKKILRNILARRNPQYQDIEKKGLYVSVNNWIGSKEKFGKKDYLDFQRILWNQLV